MNRARRNKAGSGAAAISGPQSQIGSEDAARHRRADSPAVAGLGVGVTPTSEMGTDGAKTAPLEPNAGVEVTTTPLMARTYSDAVSGKQKQHPNESPIASGFATQSGETHPDGGERRTWADQSEGLFVDSTI